MIIYNIITIILYNTIYNITIISITIYNTVTIKITSALKIFYFNF